MSDISFLEFCQFFFKRSKTICAILVDDIMRNKYMNLFQIWASGSGGDVVLKISYLELW